MVSTNDDGAVLLVATISILFSIGNLFMVALMIVAYLVLNMASANQATAPLASAGPPVPTTPVSEMPVVVANPVEADNDLPTAVVTLLPASTSAPAPITDIPMQPDITPASPFVSGGLGLTRSEWEAGHGLPYAEIAGLPRYGIADVQSQDIMYERDMIQMIVWQIALPVSIDAAMAAADQYKPGDAQYLTSYAPDGRPETTVDVFSSVMLAERLGQAPHLWIGGEPGTFIVQYNRYPDGVTQAILSTGNNP